MDSSKVGTRHLNDKKDDDNLVDHSQLPARYWLWLNGRHGFFAGTSSDEEQNEIKLHPFVIYQETFLPAAAVDVLSRTVSLCSYFDIWCTSADSRVSCRPLSLTCEDSASRWVIDQQQCFDPWGSGAGQR